MLSNGNLHAIAQRMLAKLLIHNIKRKKVIFWGETKQIDPVLHSNGYVFCIRRSLEILSTQNLFESALAKGVYTLLLTRGTRNVTALRLLQ